MMRSMYAGVTGLRTHQNKMDVIGNNIANVNTVAYKRGTMTFQEVFSETIRGASGPQGGRGGTNPQQIGLGVGVGAINTVHTKGHMQGTDNPTDLMIDGEGFFVVSDDSNYENRYYTRAGNFQLDRDGTLVTADGHKVLGYKLDENGKPTAEAGDIVISKSETKAPTATNKIRFKGNLDSKADQGEPGHKSNTIIKDSLGNSYLIDFKFVKDETADDKNTTWTLTVDRITEQSTGNYATDVSSVMDGVKITFNADGEIAKINDEEPDKLADAVKLKEDELSKITFNMTKDKVEIDNGNSPAGNFRDIIIFDPQNSETYKNLHQYANDMDAQPYALDGNSSGKLQAYTIDQTGMVVGIFDNGEQKNLAQIMLAKFDNPAGLEKTGGNFYRDTRNSGEPQYGLGAGSGFGGIRGGTLEMSNVDLSMEFTEMITTQRGFQANSRIITTSDEMLQELVNLKR